LRLGEQEGDLDDRSDRRELAVHGARHGTRTKAQVDIFDHVERFYNRERCCSTLDDASPVKFLEDWSSARYERKLTA
jgi:hypothetical protein